MVFLRRAVWPVRELVARLERDEIPLINEETPLPARSQDHVLQIADAIDTFRDILSGLQDLYLSSISNRMNDVMKVLTIFASIFVPLTFIAGIYGMNFEHMPELSWRWGYPVFWGVILAIGVTLLVLFRRQKWF
jgi:magnesium transporter